VHTDRQQSKHSGYPDRTGLCILGSTGSIGTQTLDIARLFPDRLDVRVLTARGRVDLLIEQAREFNVPCVVVEDETKVDQLRDALPGVRVLAGAEGLREVVSRSDVSVVMAAVVGFAGLVPVLDAIASGKRIALANKETMVAGGELVNHALHAYSGTLIPVDSEHSAIFQCLVGEAPESVEDLILTASGGPFRERPAESFSSITAEEALNHPNWSMGAKITVDSATMMNKGLEVIEAHWLFDIPVSRIHVLVHPQSIIHSMACFRDGSSKAQLGLPDMKVPIQYALSYPDRWEAPHERANWVSIQSLEFEEPDLDRFPCLALAYDAIRTGGSAPAVLNAANEVAVAQFLQGEITFVDVPRIIESTMNSVVGPVHPRVQDLVEVDREARRAAAELSRRDTH
jgi:1-deoxy-D-xylulose-5-phosphate reductoisomerase